MVHLIFSLSQMEIRCFWTSAKQTAALSALICRFTFACWLLNQNIIMFFLPWFLFSNHSSRGMKPLTSRNFGEPIDFVSFSFSTWKWAEGHIPRTSKTQLNRILFTRWADCLSPPLAMCRLCNTWNPFLAKALQSVHETGRHRNSSNSNPQIHEIIKCIWNPQHLNSENSFSRRSLKLGEIKNIIFNCDCQSLALFCFFVSLLLFFLFGNIHLHLKCNLFSYKLSYSE